MTARFDSEVMLDLDKLYRQHVMNEAGHFFRNATARVSDSGRILFVPPGQNAAAVLQQFHDEALDASHHADENLTDGKILQPRRLSLRVF